VFIEDDMRNDEWLAWIRRSLTAVFVAVVPGALLAFVAWRLVRRWTRGRTAVCAPGLAPAASGWNG
jgi:hypothetical protein